MSVIRKAKEVYYNYGTYLENSNYLYGITPKMKSEVVEKLKKQKEYLQNTYLQINGEITKVSLFDLSSSANVQPARYHGEIWNRVTALQKYAQHIGFLTPVFMTITPKSQHKPTKQIEIKKNVFKLYNNKNFDGSTEYVKDAMRYISDKWRRFTRERIFTDIKKSYGERVIFMRTYEPHIDGTPHAHLVAFIPPEFKDRFVKVAQHFFNESRFDIKTEFDGEKGGVIAYILKYILKSFENAKNGEIDEVASWYCFHKIRRFTTSRTLIPLQIFRRVQKVESLQDMFNSTIDYKKGHFEVSLSYHPLTPLYYDITELTNQDYKIATISFLVDDGEGASFQVIYEKNFNIDFFVPDRKTNFKVKRIEHSPKAVPVQILGDLRQFFYKDGKLIEVVRSINNYSKYDLLQYYYSLDPEKCNLQHFGYVKNECVRRGLIKGEIESLDLFSTDIFSDRVNPFEHEFKALRTHYCIIGAVNSLSSLIPYLNQGA